jgi:hypothetical protein
VRVLRTADKLWRAEQHRDGWRLTHLGVLLLTRATLDQVVNRMIEGGGKPEDLFED